jgi:hypothetical protein
MIRDYSDQFCFPTKPYQRLSAGNDQLQLIKAKPVGLTAEREKIPFQVTPSMPYLTRYGDELTNPTEQTAKKPSS